MASIARKRKFRKVTFKLSDKEFQLLENCAEFDETTINKFIKSSMRSRLTDLKPLIKEKEEEGAKNQLSLFDFERKYNQISMFEEYKDFFRK